MPATFHKHVIVFALCFMWLQASAFINIWIFFTQAPLEYKSSKKAVHITPLNQCGLWHEKGVYYHSAVPVKVEKHAIDQVILPATVTRAE